MVNIYVDIVTNMIIARQRFGKNVPVATNEHRKQNNRGTGSYVDLYSVLPEVIKELVQFKSEPDTHPCGVGVEYLHRDPASRRRRRKGKSQN
jgi:hypothetical protein